MKIKIHAFKGLNSTGINTEGLKAQQQKKNIFQVPDHQKYILFTSTMPITSK